MTKGRVFEPEAFWSRDQGSGLPVRQLTAGPQDSHHLYFTNSGWYDGGRRLVFVSTRDGATNLFGLDLERGRFVQLTDERGTTDGLMFTCVNPRRAEAYFWRSNALVAIDLTALGERVLHVAPSGFRTDMTSVTADGTTVLTALCADLSDRFAIDLLRGYVGFEAYWAARPRSIVTAIDVADGRARAVFEEDAWIGHVNASPTVPHLATYCHEGPWTRVDNRIWGLDLRDGRTWPIRQKRDGEAIGHEYWMADGVTLGFHGKSVDGTGLFGIVRFDDTGCREAPLALSMMHVHSNDTHAIVGDGSDADRQIYVWRFDGDAAPVPVPIMRHDSAAAIQSRHVHPRFDPGGQHLLFVSDRSGVGNLYQVRVADLRARGLA
jgi:oligogalacturonide lyase